MWATIKLTLVSLVTASVCMFLLTYVTKGMLAAVEQGWVEGKAEVEYEKQQFSTLVKAMYPPKLAERLMAGETQIVLDVPQAAVCFSDIYHFTLVSNSISTDGKPCSWGQVLKHRPPRNRRRSRLNCCC